MCRVICGCPKKKFIGEGIAEGKVLCSCGNMNDIKDSTVVKYYPNKLSNSYQDRLNLRKKGA